MTLVMQERAAPSRPLRLGTRRRAPRKGARCEAEGGSARAQRAASLDTGNYLATSVRDWIANTETEEDRYHNTRRLHSQLMATVEKIWRRHEQEEDADGANKWEKQWLQLFNCQKEWVGYYADCCKGFTAPVAVPIGCNHRLCPLCCWHRSEKSRRRIRTMFDRLTHPALITLTIPNKKTVRKHDFTLFRQRTRQFIKHHEGWIRGGVYSLETTFNRQERTWHVHVHILVDLVAPLPQKSDKVTVRGQTLCRFTVMKRRLEFDWLRLWNRSWGRRPRRDCSQMVRAGDEHEFGEWFELSQRHSIRVRVGGRLLVRPDLTPKAIQLAFEWNRENRRVVHLKPVTDREGAAREVLKYITKVSMFSDLPEAVEPFVNAVRGARLIQTFGSWYGVKLDDPADANHPRDWEQLACRCGMNVWKRLGVFARRDVEMDEGGRWHLRRPHDWKSPGTVPRPTIRALDVREG
jgi:hypothetical protein